MYDGHKTTVSIYNGRNVSTLTRRSKTLNQNSKTLNPFERNNITYNSIPVFDASSKVHSGFLGGNLMDFGAFDQCIQIHEHTPSGLIQGKHCIAEIKPSDKIIEIILSYRNLTLDRLHDLTGGSGVAVQWAICIPDSCTADDVQEHLSRSLEVITEGADVNVTVRNESCVSVNTRKKLEREDYAFCIFLGGITALVFFSTLYDLHCRTTNHGPNALLISFSLYTNTINILKPPRDGMMGAIFGLRFITMCWIIGGHRFLMFMFFPLQNTLDVLNWMTKMSSMFVIGGTFSVDTFFFISGLLLAYLFFKQMKHGSNQFNVLLFWVNRYLRLTPSYGATILLYSTVLYHIENGPLWNDLMVSIQDACQKYWWSTLLYLQNYINPQKLCVVQTWYLQVDTQLYALSPLVLLPLHHFPKYGLIQLNVLILISILITFNLAWKNKYQGCMPVTNALLNTDYFKFFYITTHSRATVWLVGILFGYIFYKTESRKITLNKVTVISLWLISITIMLACIFGSHPFVQPERPYNRTEASIYLSLSRFSWALSIGWVLFACNKGYGGVINTFLSASIFQIWGRISYNMFLLHMLIQYVLNGSGRLALHFSNVTAIHLTFGDIAYTTIIAFIFTLYFESPIVNISKILLQPKGKSKRVKPETAPEKNI